MIDFGLGIPEVVVFVSFALVIGLGVHFLSSAVAEATVGWRLPVGVALLFAIGGALLLGLASLPPQGVENQSLALSFLAVILAGIALHGVSQGRQRGSEGRGKSLQDLKRHLQLSK